MSKTGVAAVRGLATVALIAVASWPVAALTTGPIRRLGSTDAGLAGLGFEDGLVALCAGGLLLCWTWFALTTSLLILWTVRGVHPLHGGGLARVSPRAVQRLVAVVCGITLSTGLGAAAASADPPRPRTPSAWTAGAATGATTGSTTGLSGLVLPDRTTGTADTVGRRRQVTVAPGDSLWSISRRQLPPDAGNAEIARAVHALLVANSERIGADPDLIFPRTTLTVPPAAHHPRKDTP